MAFNRSVMEYDGWRMQHIKQNHTSEKRVDGFIIQTKQSLMQAKQIYRYLQVIGNDTLFNQKI